MPSLLNEAAPESKKTVVEGIPIFNVNVTNSPNSCLLKVQQLQYRALVDSGAEISLISKQAYDNLKYPIPFQRKKVFLQSVNGGALNALGSVDLEIKIGGLRLKQTFVIVTDLNRHVILGRDFLVNNGVRLYFDLGKLRIKNVYIPLERDVHIASITRISKTVLLKPQTINVVLAHVKKRNYFKPSQLFLLEKIERGHLSEEPELILEPSVVKVSPESTLPVIITNTSNKFIKLKKGSVLGSIKEVQVVDTVSQNLKHTTLSDEEFVENIKVDEQHRDIVSPMLLRNKDLFAFSDLDLGHTDLLEAEIITDDARPINLRPYRIPLAQREVVSKAMDDMLAANIIKPSSSPWNFPVVLVDKKPDGPNAVPQKRICIDFRELNKVVKPQSFPIPLIDDILGNLAGSTFYSTLDLRQGFHQIKLSDESAAKTAFSCFKGKYQYNVLPFGLCNSPSIFQQMANKLLLGLEDIAVAYLDDVLIHTKSTKEHHLEQVQKVLDRIRKHNLKLKLPKCRFLKKETNYLGFIISEHGIKPDQEKVQAIRSWKCPTNAKECRSLLGMSGWYRRFIPNFSKIAEPIVALTRKYSRFKWTNECQKAFEYLKESLSTIPLLAYPDPNRPYILYTDASDTCVGACLVQECDDKEEWVPGIKNEKPIYFLSHKLSPTQVKYPVIQKECFAIVYALQKLDYYLNNATFVIRTDHQPLKYLLKSQIQNKTIQQWALTISSYNCTIEYIKGIDNSCADLLSRSPPETEENPVEVPPVSDRAFNIAAINTNKINVQEYLDPEVETDKEGQERPTLEGFDMIKEQDKDPEIVRIKQQLELGTADKTTYARFMTADNLLYYISQVDDEPTVRLYIPPHLQQQIIVEYHDHGHFAVNKVFQSIKEKYYWPNLYKQIEKHIEKCITCKVRNQPVHKAPLQDMRTPVHPMAVVELDLSGPYKKTPSNNVYIASFIDVYSGWLEAYPLPDKSADSVVNVLVEEFIPRHSTPWKLITDNGSEFVNHAFETTLKRMNILHAKTSFYHPEGNAKVERSHRSLHDILSKLMEGQIDNWDIVLNQALYSLRCQPSRTTGVSPFFILYNRQPTLPIDNILQPRRKYMGQDFFEMALENQHKMFMLVHKNSREAKKKRDKYANKRNKCKDVTFKVGDSVFYKNHAKTNKLEGNWRTHFIIVKQTSPVSFVVRNQLTGKTAKAHANSLRQANLEWHVPKNKDLQLRKSVLVEARDSTTPESSTEEAEVTTDNSETGIKNSPISPRRRLIRNKKLVRDNTSSSDDEAPPFEIQKRARARASRKTDSESHSSDQTIEYGLDNNEEQDAMEMSNQDLGSGDGEDNISSADTIEYGRENLPDDNNIDMNSADGMSVNGVREVEKKGPKGRQFPHRKPSMRVRNLVDAMTLAGMI